MGNRDLYTYFILGSYVIIITFYQVNQLGIKRITQKKQEVYPQTYKKPQHANKWDKQTET